MKNIKNIIILLLSIFVFSGCSLIGGRQYSVFFMVDDEVYHNVIDTASNIVEPEISPVKDGFEFAGWYFDKDYNESFSQKSLKTKIDEEIEVYAKFLQKYTLSFESNCSTNMSSILDAYVDSIPNVTNSGYSLLGWYFDASFTNKVELPFELEGNTTIYARWIKAESIVTYYLDGVVYDVETVAYDSVPTLPMPENRLGYTFSGWKTANGSSYVHSGYFINDLVLYANYDPNVYQIYFDYDIAQPTVVSASIVYGTKFTNLPIPLVEGYNFNGWYYNGNKIINNQTVFNYDSNITLVASFTVKNCSINFFDHNNQKMLGYSSTVQYGTDISTITFPSVTMVDGYYYIWLIDDSDNIPNGFKVNNHLNIYLNYNPIMYMITYDYGNSETESVYIYYDDVINLLNVDRYGYIFNGWLYDGNLLNAGAKYHYLEDITLYADYSLDSFTITFYDKDQNLYATRDVEYTKDLTDIPTIPSVTGYTGAWYVHNNSTHGYEPATYDYIEKDMSIYAIYTANTYQTTFKVNAQNFDVINQTYGNVIKLPSNIPQLQDKVFMGWYYNGNKLTGTESYLYDYDIVITASFADKNLVAPTISYDQTTDMLSWNKIDNASSYKLYANDTIVAQIDNTATSYKVSNAGLGAGTYNICLVAAGANGFFDSNKSNVVSIVYTSDINEITVNSKNIEYYTGKSVNLQLNTTTNTITWTSDDTVEKYVVFIITENETKSYATRNNSICVYDIVDDVEISAIRVGAQYSGSNVVYLADDLCYYNPIDLSEYGNTVYLFDGQINDYYITSMEELNNIMYYSFIKKFSQISFFFDSDFVTSLMAKYGQTNYNAINLAVSEAMDSYTETMYMSTSMTVGNNGTYYYAQINYDHQGVYQCNTSVNAYKTYAQDRYDAIYEIYDGTARSATYNDYISDNKFLYTFVNTSEELYWAIENGYTPAFTNTSSRAYIIYNQAKIVLNSIIYEEMSDYEKALAIFDWIALNTSYDFTPTSTYQAYGYNGYTAIPSYYLEGVFINGFAVCDGFSKAFSMMCNMEGIDAIRIVGEAKSGGSAGGHAWNKVIINDECYVVDITWTEIIRSSTTENLTHEYFMVSDEYIASTHMPHENRDKFFLSKYNASGNHKSFYENVKYLYKSLEHDFVIDSDTEFKDVLDFAVDNARVTVEIILDYNYLLSLSGNSSISSSNITNFCVEYLNPKMSDLKFETLYIEVTSNYDFINYDSYNNRGLFYVLEFHMMIDEIDDVEYLLARCQDNNMSYDLVISIQLLVDTGYAAISGTSLLPAGDYSDLMTALYAFINNNATDTYDYNFGDNGYYHGSYCYLTITF
ncbi:MAG: InlB B-repeat-containing protein [Clostridia bacterium]|nr:InlB B-repeat-containing protein [Clostridia bacterium]